MTEMAIEVDKDVKETKNKVRVAVIGDVKQTNAIKSYPVAEHNIVRVIEGI